MPPLLSQSILSTPRPSGIDRRGGAIHTTLHRKGRMTDWQNRHRAAIEKTWKAPPSGILSSFGRLVAQIPDVWDSRTMPVLRLRTDEHRIYPQAIRTVPALALALQAGTFVHQRFPSSAPRSLANPLFSVNYHDREFRKDIAAFRRESTCFTRNVSNGLLRFANYVVWHNYFKNFRVRSSGLRPQTHAVRAGIRKDLLDRGLKRLFLDRSFLSRHPIPLDWIDVWMKRFKTPLNFSPDYVPLFAKTENMQASVY